MVITYIYLLQSCKWINSCETMNFVNAFHFPSFKPNFSWLLLKHLFLKTLCTNAKNLNICKIRVKLNLGFQLKAPAAVNVRKQPYFAMFVSIILINLFTATGGLRYSLHKLFTYTFPWDFSWMQIFSCLTLNFHIHYGNFSVLISFCSCVRKHCIGQSNWCAHRCTLLAHCEPSWLQNSTSCHSHYFIFKRFT